MAYNPKQAKDATRAQSLAVAFRDNTAKKSLTEIGRDPANRPAVVAFQDSSGLKADGVVGPLTLEAYNYWLGRPFTKAVATRDQRVAQREGAFKAAVADVVKGSAAPVAGGKTEEKKAVEKAIASPGKRGVREMLAGIPTEGKVVGAAILGLIGVEVFKGRKKTAGGHR